VGSVDEQDTRLTFQNGKGFTFKVPKKGKEDSKGGITCNRMVSGSCSEQIDVPVSSGCRNKLPQSQPLKTAPAGCQWLTSIILATQEVEIRRIMVQSQPRKIVPRDPISKNPFIKRAGGVAQGIGPEFKPQYSKNK
jgi:hypothetical protein